MPLLSLTEGWTGVLGPFTLRIDGVPFPLTGYTVTLKMRDGTGDPVTLTGTVTVNPDQITFPGQVTYTPGAGDFVFEVGTYGSAQIYKLHWKVVDGMSRVVYFPNGAPDEIEIYRA